MKEVETDPRVSCPIVCGEYMRATGFFYESGEQTYLITARHNIMPTDSDELKTGQIDLPFTTHNFFPQIDVYLQGPTNTAVESIDIRSIEGVKSAPGIDIAAIPIRFTPQKFDYVVWSEDDIVAPGSTTELLESIGFPGPSFPSPEMSYTTERYQQWECIPYSLRLVNETTEFKERSGLADCGAEDVYVGETSDYNGFSGSPVLGDGLVAVHSSAMTFDTAIFEKHGFEPCNFILYWPAVILPALLD